MPKHLEWKPEYSVGVPVLDRQHRGLIRIINKLTDEAEGDGMIDWVFDQLEAYTREHFATEERLLEQYDYADLKEHRKQHRKFEEWLRAVRLTWRSGAPRDQIVATVNEFLRDWLIRHILSSDMAYRDVLGTDIDGGGGQVGT